MADYLVPGTDAVSETEIKKSIFVGRIFRTDSEDAAVRAIEAVRKEFYKASHHCFAYIIGPQHAIMKFSDDGEPAGTAGRPILAVMEKQGLCDAVCIVTRFFGGIKLGANGLVRAYTEAAVKTAEAAGQLKRACFADMRVECDYAFYQSLVHYAQEKGYNIGECLFAQNVEFIAAVPEIMTTEFTNDIERLSRGRFVSEKIKEYYKDVGYMS